MHKLKNVPPCTYCGAKKFEYEPPNMCCQNGKIKLVGAKIPEELFSLFTSHSDEAKEFQDNIRLYNSIFSFTSFGVTLDKELASAKKGVYTFRAQGQIYHDLPSLLPSDGIPRFFQLYFYDNGNELHNRMGTIGGAKFNEVIMKKLMRILANYPYAQFFRRLGDIPSLEDLKIKITSTIRMDQ